MHKFTDNTLKFALFCILILLRFSSVLHDQGMKLQLVRTFHPSQEQQRSRDVIVGLALGQVG